MLLTVGKLAVPPKSFVSFKIPFVFAVASEAALFGILATLAATNAVVASCVELVPSEAVAAVGVPVNDGDKIVALNNISNVLVVMLVVLAAKLVFNAASALVALVISVVMLDVFELTFVVRLAIVFEFTVMLAVFDSIDVGNVAIVAELTPPTLFTVGKLAVPPKSPAN